MPRLLAIAFHESVSIQKLAELFRSDWHQLFAGTTAAHCKKCGRQFAVFFPASDDPDNVGYLTRIEEMIANDCEEGRHVEQISLTIG